MFLDVAIPSRVFHPFTYAVPDGTNVVPGMRVRVPFRRGETIGFVLRVQDAAPKIRGEIKSISAVIDQTPLISTNMIEWLMWMARYYCAPIGEICRAAFPRALWNTTPRARRATLAPMERREVHTSTFALRPTPEQTVALETFRAAADAHGGTFLLHGITGSGKTEVYLQLFEHLRAREKQSLLLVPEIGLTPQLSQCVLERFGERVALYHSGLTDAQRLREWERMRAGEVDIVVGTRSALFAPLPQLAAIVVDEEHDSSYKQDDGVLYHARDAAVMRGALESAVVVLGSATPSLESYANARAKKYSYVPMLHRATGAELPRVHIVDLRRKPQPTNTGKHDALVRGLESLSPSLHAAIEQITARGEQALLFLNRRGFARFLLCEACGNVPECPNCNIALTYHQGRKQLRCHYCDFALPAQEACPDCGCAPLTPRGQGTERLEAELADFFPDKKLLRLDSDTIDSGKTRHAAFRRMRDGDVDILVGTQMVTKGHDFPGVTLVGVISADEALHQPDFRAAERAFHMLTQVAGRAGRADKAGKVIVQTWQPEHHSVRHASQHDYAAFFAEESAQREALGYPPFGRLANLRFSGNEESRVQRAAKRSAEQLRTVIAREQLAIDVLGPAPAPLAKLRNRHRWQLLLKARSAQPLQRLLAHMHERLQKETPAGVRLSVDVDPVNLM